AGVPAGPVRRGRRHLPADAARAPLRPGVRRRGAAALARRARRPHPAAGGHGHVRRRVRGLLAGEHPAGALAGVPLLRRAGDRAGRRGDRPDRDRRRPLGDRRADQARGSGAGLRGHGPVRPGAADAHAAGGRCGVARTRGRAADDRAGPAHRERPELHRRARRPGGRRRRHRRAGLLRLLLLAGERLHHQRRRPGPHHLARPDRGRAGRRVPGLPAAQLQPGAHLHGRLGVDAHRSDARRGRDQPHRPGELRQPAPDGRAAGAAAPAAAVRGAGGALRRPAARRRAPHPGGPLAVRPGQGPPAPPAARDRAQPHPGRADHVLLDRAAGLRLRRRVAVGRPPAGAGRRRHGDGAGAGPVERAAAARGEHRCRRGRAAM
ncbi:MAG: Decaprenyl-phosphate N-acetylglucosaminephosphotransferase, partial [uncultured Frankineae bacterium]